MPTSFSKNLEDVDMSKTTTHTASVEGQAEPENTEKFDPGKWMLSITAIVNDHRNRIHQLERSNMYLRIMVVVFLMAFTYIWR